MKEAHAWLRARNVYYTFDESDIIDGVWKVAVDQIYLKSFRCEWSRVWLHIYVDASRNTNAWYLSFEDNCLWHTSVGD